MLATSNKTTTFTHVGAFSTLPSIEKQLRTKEDIYSQLRRTRMPMLSKCGKKIETYFSHCSIKSGLSRPSQSRQRIRSYKPQNKIRSNSSESESSGDEEQEWCSLAAGEPGQNGGSLRTINRVQGEEEVKNKRKNSSYLSSSIRRKIMDKNMNLEAKLNRKRGVSIRQTFSKQLELDFMAEKLSRAKYNLAMLNLKSGKKVYDKGREYCTNLQIPAVKHLRKIQDRQNRKIKKFYFGAIEDGEGDNDLLGASNYSNFGVLGDFVADNDEESVLESLDDSYGKTPEKRKKSRFFENKEQKLARRSIRVKRRISRSSVEARRGSSNIGVKHPNSSFLNQLAPPPPPSSQKYPLNIKLPTLAVNFDDQERKVADQGLFKKIKKKKIKPSPKPPRGTKSNQNVAKSMKNFLGKQGLSKKGVFDFFLMKKNQKRKKMDQRRSAVYNDQSLTVNTSKYLSSGYRSGYGNLGTSQTKLRSKREISFISRSLKPSSKPRLANHSFSVMEPSDSHFMEIGSTKGSFRSIQK